MQSVLTETEFRDLADRHRRELIAHCYRMLGSLADAEDMLQETMLRAWQAMERFEGRASLRTWLYRIATNACLDQLAARKRRELPTTIGAPGRPGDPLPPPSTDIAWLEPLPDTLLAGDADRGPEARYSERESVALAFVTALQALPARQRSVLLLRDVIGFSADETAGVLDLTAAAVNSALQRARKTLEDDAPRAPRHLPTDDATVASLLERFVRAWEEGDPDGLVALLREDAVSSMPPMPLYFQGVDAVAAFVRGMFAQRATTRALVTGANGQPAVALYGRRDDGLFHFDGLSVLSIDGDQIAAIESFLALGQPSPLPARFGLPETLV